MNIETLQVAQIGTGFELQLEGERFGFEKAFKLPETFRVIDEWISWASFKYNGEIVDAYDSTPEAKQAFSWLMANWLQEGQREIESIEKTLEDVNQEIKACK